MQADIARAVLLDRRQRLGHAVDERLDPMKPVRGRAMRLGDQVFAAAEADLQPNVVNLTEQVAQIGRRRMGQIEHKTRQQPSSKSAA